MKRIIVLIPHYNSVSDLLLSIKSINESFSVDLLIVDDGSKKHIPNLNTLEKNYSNGRVFLEILPENMGIEYALNKGLELIENMQYEYIGRLDCGDTCVKNRFKKQVSYLDKNNNTYLLGTWANITNKSYEKLYVLKHPTRYDQIKRKMFTNSMFVHPSVVFRSSLLNEVGYYPTKYKAAEDYAYFFEIIKKYKSENLGEPLLNYVLDEKSISTTKRKLQVKSRIRIIIKNFEFGFYPVYGLLRNIMLYFISRETSSYIKRLLRS
jgi:hypothetical protein